MPPRKKKIVDEDTEAVSEQIFSDSISLNSYKSQDDEKEAESNENTQQVGRKRKTRSKIQEPIRQGNEKVATVKESRDKLTLKQESNKNSSFMQKQVNHGPRRRVGLSRQAAPLNAPSPVRIKKV